MITFDTLIKCWMSSHQPDRCRIYESGLGLWHDPLEGRTLLTILNGDYLVMRDGTRIPLSTEFVLCTTHNAEWQEERKS